MAKAILHRREEIGGCPTRASSRDAGSSRAAVRIEVVMTLT